MKNSDFDLVIVGAGAAGFMAGISAARQQPGLRIGCFDGARKLGAKILVSGGGRCNVTNEVVTPADFHGASGPALRKILSRFPVEKTIEFFAEQGVALKLEPRGKLFPVENTARSVLGALLVAAREAGVTLAHPRRVQRIVRTENGFTLSGDWGQTNARRVILASGGLSLPRTGSDGGGYRLAASLGVETGARIFPALVPLRIREGAFPTSLSGVSSDVVLNLTHASGKKIASVEGPMLCTHFGISGPAALDISRSWIDVCHDDADARVTVCWLPQVTEDELDHQLRELGATSVARHFRRWLPERLARALATEAGVAPSTLGHALTRDARRALVKTAIACELEIIGDRGWNHAEVTAGGVPLSVLRLRDLEARGCPGLHLCGEICDVEGRLGGFNFQWAWASGFVAGSGAAEALCGENTVATD